jgi:hypothetical protein
LFLHGLAHLIDHAKRFGVGHDFEVWFHTRPNGGASRLSGRFTLKSTLFEKDNPNESASGSGPPLGPRRATRIRRCRPRWRSLPSQEPNHSPNPPPPGWVFQ